MDRRVRRAFTPGGLAMTSLPYHPQAVHAPAGGAPSLFPAGHRVIAVCALLMAATFVGDLLVPLGIATGVLYLLPLVLSALLRSPRVTVAVAGAASALTLLKIPLSPGEVAPGWTWVTNRALCLVVIWLVVGLLAAIYRLARARDEVLQREAARAQLRVLSGLLSICASCKKIHTDEGTWEQIEAYIDRHSEATFSHGLCEDCRRRLYPTVG